MNHTSQLIMELDEAELIAHIGGNLPPPNTSPLHPDPIDTGAGAEASAAGGGGSFAAAMDG